MSQSLPIDYTLYSRKKLVRLLGPLLLEQFLFVAVGTADTLMLSQLGEGIISGVSLIDALNIIAAVFFAAMGTGGTVVTSQFLGAGKTAQARASAKQLLWVALIISIAFIPVIYLLRQPIFQLAYGKLPEDITRPAMTYFRITIFTYPLMSLHMAFSALFRAMNRTSLSMWGSVLMNTLNIFGNWFLIFGMRWGVAGAAISTLLSRVAAVIFLGTFLTNRSYPIWLKYKEKIQLDWQLIRRILFIGIPAGIENVIFHLGRLLTTSIVTAFGITQITANAVANNIAGLACMVGGTFSIGMITVVGQSVGTGSEKTVRYYIGKMMKYTYTCTGIWNLLLLLLLPVIVPCYASLTPETSYMVLKIMIIYQILNIFFWPLSFVFPNALRSANDVRFVMTVSICSMLLVRVGFAAYCARTFHIGVTGVWTAMYLDWLVRIAFFFWRWRSDSWKRNVCLR